MDVYIPPPRIKTPESLYEYSSANSFYTKEKLNKGNTIKRRNLNYRSRIYNIYNNSGAHKRIRKVANYSDEEANNDKKGIFEETVDEISNYEVLSELPSSESLLMPLVNSSQRNQKPFKYAFLNFQPIPGDTLEDTIKAGFPVEKIPILLHNVLNSLRWLVSNGYIHGDIKADNFFVESTGNVRLLDLGQLATLRYANSESLKDELKRLYFMFKYIYQVYTLSINNLFLETEKYLHQTTILSFSTLLEKKNFLMKLYDLLDSILRETFSKALPSTPVRGGKRKRSFSKKQKKLSKRKQTRKQA